MALRKTPTRINAVINVNVSPFTKDTAPKTPLMSKK